MGLPRRRPSSRVRRAFNRPVKQKKYRDPKPPKSVKGQREFWRTKMEAAQTTIRTYSDARYANNAGAQQLTKLAANTIREARAALRQLRNVDDI